MKKAILILLLLPIIASAQSFNVFDIDTSDYPIMKAKFYSVDENDDQILNHTSSDFEITENGNPAEVLSVSCPEPLPIPISVGIMVDNKNYINLARHGAERFVNFLNMPQNELGITYMNGRPLLFQDFTKDKAKAQNSSKQIPPAPGGTSVSEMFFDEYAGGIELIKNREAQNRILIFVSDLHCPNLSIDEQELIQQAKDNNIRIYTVLLGTTDYTGLFTRIADNTSGEVFENVRDSSEIEDIFKDILFKEQDDPCQISWNSNLTCEKSSNIEILNKSTNLKFKEQIRLSYSQYLSLELDKYFITFGTNITDTTINIIAKNGTQTINNIIFEQDNGIYEIQTSLPITIPSNNSVAINLRYIPRNDSIEYTRMKIIGDYCYTTIGLLKGDQDKSFTKKTLKLTHPNGGEEFIAGSDTIVTWEGISENDNVILEFSSDNGNIWEQLESNASNNKYYWNLPAISSDSCLIGAIHNVGLLDSNIMHNWLERYGGSFNDRINNFKRTSDNGFILVGATQSNDGDLKGVINKGAYDYLIIKIDSLKRIDWVNTFGGSESDEAEFVYQTVDKGYLILGNSNSSDKDLTGINVNGKNTCFIVKLSKDGSLQWKKTFQEKGLMHSSIQVSTGVYTIVGHKNTTPQVAELYHINENGDVLWSKELSSDQTDVIFSITETNDNNYLMVGWTTSDNIDSDGKINRGSSDAWVIKTNKQGDIIWSRTFGGTKKDEFHSVIQTKDSGYLILGRTFSTDLDLSDLENKGMSDCWIVKLDNEGRMVKSHLYGGSDIETPSNLIKTPRRGGLVTVSTSSTDGDLINVKGKRGVTWIFEIDINGNILWSNIHEYDFVSSPTFGNILGNNLYLAGTLIDSITVGHLSKYVSDIYFSKYTLQSPLQSDTSDAVFSIIMPEPVIQNNDIDMGEMIVGNTKDTIVSSVICNTGDAPLHVLGVDITGGDDADFLIPRGAGDFYLEKDECQDMMFEFTPSALGNRTAVATVRTTIGDFTDTINIRGVGINPLIEVTADVVDFGQFELGDSKDTNVVLIKNVGAEDITIIETKITGPDIEQFDILTTPLNFTISPGDEKELDLNYTARYGGRTSSIIEFHYDGVGSPLRSMLFAEGIGGEVYPQVPDAFVGERVELGLHLGRIKPEGLDEVATNFTATVSYNSTLLAPIDKNMTVTTVNTTSFIEIEGQLSGATQIATVPMKVGLGTAVSSGLVVTEFQLYDANGDSVDYEIEPGVGEFNVLGICEEGGIRLVNPNGEKVGLRVAQNRLNTSATIYIDLIESGQTDLIIYNQLGNAIETAYSGTPSTGTKEINLDLSQFGNGRYYIKLITPTITKTEIIEVVR